MTSEIRSNKIKNRAGLGTVTFSDTGAVLSGIVTANDLRTDEIRRWNRFNRKSILQW